jgi:hypothetical protein
VNLFIASELSWKAKGLVLRQETNYPEESRSQLTFTIEKPVELSLNIRRPYWAVSSFEVKVNSDPVISSSISMPGSYKTVTRTWKTGDTVEITMLFNLRTEGFRDNPRRIAFMNGPLVLCAEVKADENYPAIVAESDRIASVVAPIADKPSHFAGSSELLRVLGDANAVSLTLEPFYRMHGDRRYMVYFDVFTPPQWREKEQDYKTELIREKELQARTVDEVRPGDRQGERDHNLQGEKTASGVFADRRWRHATDGGWFSYDMKVLPDQPLELSVTCWGSDGGSRIFDILVGDTKIATQRLENNRPGKFYDEVYPIPGSLTQGKEKITVKFQAHPSAWAGGIFGVRILKVTPK